MLDVPHEMDSLKQQIKRIARYWRTRQAPLRTERRPRISPGLFRSEYPNCCCSVKKIRGRRAADLPAPAPPLLWITGAAMAARAHLYNWRTCEERTMHRGRCRSSNNPPAKPGAFGLLAPQRGLMAPEKASRFAAGPTDPLPPQPGANSRRGRTSGICRRQTLREPSNSASLPGKAGGFPVIINWLRLHWVLAPCPAWAARQDSRPRVLDSAIPRHSLQGQAVAERRDVCGRLSQG
jgi:hypothetical protein